MLGTVNHRQDSLPSLRGLEKQKIKDTKAANIPEWPEDDDDDDIPVKSKVIVVDKTDNDSANADNEATSKINDNDEADRLSTQKVSVEQDNGGDDEEIITNKNMDSSSGNQQTDNPSDIENVGTRDENGGDVLGNTTFVMGEDNSSTEYHRSQSTIQNEAPAESTGETRTFDQSDNNIDMNNGQEGSENVDTANNNIVDSKEINDSSEMATFDGNAIENPNNVDGSVPSSEQVDPPQQQSQLENTFVNYNEDDEEESFFTMIQSTLQVLFLAAFFSLGLVFRRRVMDRMSDHPSLNLSQAIQEEATKVLTDFASWLSESRNESNRDNGGVYSMSTVAERGSSIEGSGSSRVETIPLATATDEEWGWDDEDVGRNLELSGVGRDTTTEEDDLAMAIAMSLSEPVKGAHNETVPADVVNKHSSSAPSPAMETAVEKSSSRTDQLEQQLPPPTDTIEDLLGQMSSAGGPVISSFGQKAAKVEPKSKPKTIHNDTDDIFESMGMGLSSYAKKTGPSQTQQQIKTPSSTLLTAESIDENDDDGDDWGDDGDLDDLLFED